MVSEYLVPYAIRWCEGYLLSLLVACGVASNAFLAYLIKNRELNLIKKFASLLQMQAAYDLLYLCVNVPAFVLPALTDFTKKHHLVYYAPYIHPILHILLTGSCYTTVALSLERLQAMDIHVNLHRRNNRSTSTGHRRRRSNGSSSTVTSSSQCNNNNNGSFLGGGGGGGSGCRCNPCRSRMRSYPDLDRGDGSIKKTVVVVFLVSLAINFPRFFEMTVEHHEENSLQMVNNTGNASIDLQFFTRVLPHLEVNPSLGSVYFVYYSQVFSFLAITFVPSVALAVLNTMVYRRLQRFKSVSARLGKEARRTVRATCSLVSIVLFHLGCHSFKVVLNGYQVVQIVSAGEMVYTWPWWAELLTVASHVSLAANAAVNLALYCVCDKRFFILATKTVKLAFVYPFTLGCREQTSDNLTVVTHCNSGGGAHSPVIGCANCGGGGGGGGNNNRNKSNSSSNSSSPVNNGNGSALHQPIMEMSEVTGFTALEQVTEL